MCAISISRIAPDATSAAHHCGQKMESILKSTDIRCFILFWVIHQTLCSIIQCKNIYLIYTRVEISKYNSYTNRVHILNTKRVFREVIWVQNKNIYVHAKCPIFAHKLYLHCVYLSRALRVHFECMAITIRNEFDCALNILVIHPTCVRSVCTWFVLHQRRKILVCTLKYVLVYVCVIYTHLIYPHEHPQFFPRSCLPVQCTHGSYFKKYPE